MPRAITAHFELPSPTRVHPPPRLVAGEHRAFALVVGDRDPQESRVVIGAVFCLEASRLARNGRGWHHLLELCGLVGARVVDGEAVYDPSSPNDRLLLGLKGTMSEFELTVLRRRLLDAAIAEARRRELRMPVPELTAELC